MMTPQPDELGKKVVQMFDRMKLEKQEYEATLQEIKDLVRPHAADFNRRGTTGDVRSTAIYDSTPVQAADELTNALTSNTTPSTERWFGFEADGDPELNRDPEAIKWFEEVADIVYAEYSNSRSKFYPSVYETNADLVAFGTDNLGQEWDAENGHILFRAHPLADTYLSQDWTGTIDSVCRELEYDTRQLVQQFPQAAEWDDFKNDTKQEKKWCVIHSVHPRKDASAGAYSAKGKPFASCWVLKDKCVTLSEGGYDSLPYHTTRWSVMPGEIYGRGPAMLCLPSIRLVNRMQYTLLKAAERAVLPPMVVPNDGFAPQIKIGPDSLIFKEPGAENIEFLRYEGSLPVTMEMVEMVRNDVRKSFYADWVKFNQKSERQTAYEISELVDQQLRMMGGVNGRLNNEKFGPCLSRTVELLSSHRKLPEAPQILQGKRFKISYQSIAARAQISSKATAIGRFMQESIPMFQVNPEAIDAIDVDALIQESAYYRGVPRRIIRSVEAIQTLRQDREQQRQMQQIAGAAEPVSKSILNLAQAQQAGNVVGL